MTSQISAMGAPLFLLSLLAILSTVSRASGGSRFNDSTEINSHSTLNTTRLWSPSLVSAANPVEEGILNSERNRETFVWNNKKTNSNPLDQVVDPNKESPQLEEDILNLEKNRELNLNDNLDSLAFQEPSDIDSQTKIKEYSISDGDKQQNASLGNPVEEGILGSERDRDETLSDIFQSKGGSNNDQKRDYGSEYKTDITDREIQSSHNEPKFQYLIGLPTKNFSGQWSDGEDIEGQTRKPFVPPKSAWPVPQAQFLTAEPKLNLTTGLPVTEDSVLKPSVVEDYVELVEIVKNSPTESGINKSVPVFPHVNRTGFFLENDAPESIFSMFAGFTDLQTLFLACFATLVPLVIALMLACGLRFAWRRYWRGGGRRGAGYGGGLRGNLGGGSTDPIADKRDRSSDSQLKAAESGFSERDVGDSKQMTGKTSPSQQPANGSIITMTLKNNHLIVETEVRNDIVRGSRETKMKYSPNNDGVFVVEVQQSTAQAGGSPERRALVHHPVASAVDTSLELQDTAPKSQVTKHQSLNTGLSTSDLSISSDSSRNPSYTYGNQVGYEQGPYGYPIYAGYSQTPTITIPCESSREPLLSKTPTDPDKPVITAAIFKQDSIIAGDDAVKSSEYNIEGSTDGPLLSDIQAREISLHMLQDKLEGGGKIKMIANSDSVPSSDTEEEKYQEQQRQLGNGAVKKEQTVVEINHDKTNQCLHRADSLPPRLIEPPNPDNKTISNNDDGFDIIEEESGIDCYPGDIASGSPLLCHNAGMVAAGARNKRASLPIITPDLYSTIKQTTKNMLPSLSPKFEKFSNENSPMESYGDRQILPPPLITVTEEAENPGSEDGDVFQS